ncbi:MAG: helix-turn-helix transcriptional regulator [Candidatus Levybacteria bacterium]|nr:helix-turn-helix transcriptional regulator [Candidatus Levybacteria bacterium]
MINSSYKRFFTTLGNENRLQIIHLLAKKGPQSVSQIVNGTKLEQSAVSHNLKRLLLCQFVHLKPNGKERVYSINKETIKPLLTLMDKHVREFCQKTCKKCERGDLWITQQQ